MIVVYTKEQLDATRAHEAARQQLNAAHQAYRDAVWDGIPAKVRAAEATIVASKEAVRVAGVALSASFGVKS